MAKSEFNEVAIISDPDGLGLVASITVRERDNGYQTFSFAIFKEFDRGGDVQRTVYLNARHVGAVRKLLDRVEERIELETDKIHETRRREASP